MSAFSEAQSRAMGFEMFVSRELGFDVFFGVSDEQQRKARVRTVLRTRDFATRVLNDLQGWETWQSRFERIYGEAL